MKVIISLILIFSSISASYAATPVLSLEKQMQKQNLINQKNTLAEKRAVAEARKKANQDRLAVLRAKKNQSKSTTQVVTKTPTATVEATAKTQPKNTIVSTASSTVTSTPTPQTDISGVDMARVRSTWLSWYNDTRASRGLGAYSYDSRLNSTSHDWNTVFAASRGTNYHERNPGDGYYKYSVIDAWFKARGVNPPVISRVNHSENVSYGYYRCSESDCTDELISAIRSSYNFFINSSVHAKSVYQPNFTKIGLDVIVVPGENRYYVTVHYMTR